MLNLVGLKPARRSSAAVMVTTGLVKVTPEPGPEKTQLLVRSVTNGSFQNTGVSILIKNGPEVVKATGSFSPIWQTLYLTSRKSFWNLSFQN